MAIQQLWQLYRTQGYDAVRNASMINALDHFYVALLAFGEEAFAQATTSAHRAAELDPKHPVFVQGAAYLDRIMEQGKAGVYVDGEAFAAFIRGGGNVGLYAAISNELRAIYQSYETLTLLDIGVGDGFALLPALTNNITQLDVLEPSEAMLVNTTAQLDSWGVTYRAHHTTIQEFMRIGREEGFDEQWNLIQATWSLQSIHPDQRPAIFGWMRRHSQHVVIAEFDVPGFSEQYAPERVQYIVDRYQKGLAEYEGDQVAQGFLMPVMFGYFDRSASRTNYEEPIQSWADKLLEAGFEDVQARLLYHYWWADAYVVEGR